MAGILNLRSGPPPGLEALARMAGAQRHRGPDGAGIYRDARCGLAHLRLAIIDLQGGAQPLSNEDGTLWISFNGEIFNYPELREELARLGHRFRTASDTEVIVHAFEAWGDACFERFNGQWALALWDAARDRLTLARDRLGVRPLHCCEHEGRLLFASEVKAIFAAAPGVPRAFDPAGLAECFTFWSPVAPRTPFRGVEELAPAEVRAYGPDGAYQTWRSWRPRRAARDGAGRFDGSLEDAADAVRARLTEATRLRMVRADVPVACYVSGGLDSALVAALAARATPHLRTFSLRFADPDYDETPWQRLVVERLGGTEHTEVLVDAADVTRAFADAVWHAERPLLRTAPAPLLLLARAVRAAGMKVVLTGEGADEMFAGYDLFREAKVRRFWARQPASSLRPVLLRRLYPWLRRSPVAHGAMSLTFFRRGLERPADPGFAHQLRWDGASALRRLLAPPFRDAPDPRAELLASLPPEAKGWTPLGLDQELEIRTLLSGYLLSSQGDRMLMASSVEGRFPFLDREVVELAHALPDAYKLRVLDEKHVVKRAARGLVPDEILRRPKQPYRAPGARALAAPGGPRWAEEAIAPVAVRAVGVFEPEAVSALWAKCRAATGAPSNQDDMALAAVLSTQLLGARLLAAPPAVTPVEPALVIDRLAGREAGPRPSTLVDHRRSAG